MKQSLLLFILCVSLSSPVFAQSKTITKKHSVEIFFIAGINEFNRHNLDSFMKQFADDIEMYAVTSWVPEEKNVRIRFTETFKQFPKVKMDIEDLQVREVEPSTVVTNFKWRVYPMGAGLAFHGVGLRVYILRNKK